MAVTIKGSLAGVVAATPLVNNTSTTNMFFMLCGTSADPAARWAAPTTRFPGFFSDLFAGGLEISTGGGYTTGGHGVSMGTANINFSTTSQVMEIALPTGPTWTSAATYSVSFRYIVIGIRSVTGSTDPAMLSVIDTGTTTTLSAQQLSFTVPVSTLFPGTYPIARWTA